MNLFDQTVLPFFEDHRASWLEMARETAIRLSKKRGIISIDDVRIECPPPPGVDPRVMGAVFRPSKHWKQEGYKSSERGTCHNRPVALWRYIGP